jgi:hypothetical protein
MKKFIYYLPRVLAILITTFFYLFVLEGFSPEFGWQSGLMHFILATAVLLFTILAWKRPKIGGWFFLLTGLYFFRSLPICLALILVGVLFLIEWVRKK